MHSCNTHDSGEVVRRAVSTEDLRSLDQTAHSHTWKKDLKKAGTGPEGFRELRERIPRHPR